MDSESALTAADLNEVLSIRAQECDRRTGKKGELHRHLNEVLSIRAQESLPASGLISDIIPQ